MNKLWVTGLLALLLVVQLVPADAASPAKSSSSSLLSAPLAVMGICAGFVVGSPIAIARRFVHDEKSGTRGIAGDTSNPWLLAPAAVISLPFAAISGFCEGPVYAFRNSYMADKPFSKEQFSLGEMPQYDSTEILKPSD